MVTLITPPPLPFILSIPPTRSRSAIITHVHRRIRKCLTLAVALAVVASAAAAEANKNNNNKPPATGTKQVVDCAAVDKQSKCKKAKTCFWDKGDATCIDESEVTCDMATQKSSCNQIGCWFDTKAKVCMEDFEATCANAYSLKACRAINAGCWFDRANKLCMDQEEKPTYPSLDCSKKTKKKQCKVFENCAWRSKTKKCIVSPQLAIDSNSEEDGEE